MRLTFQGHACVTVEDSGTTLVVDPGVYSDAAGALAGADAVLITHEHADHVDLGSLQAAMAESPALRVWAPEVVVGHLATALGDDGARVTVARPGDILHIEAFQVTVGGGQHAVVHPDIPRVANVTYLVSAGERTVYHPGDSFSLPDLRRPDVLLVPASAPWLKIAEAIDFVREFQPRVVVPIHGAHASEIGHDLVNRMLGEGGLGGTYLYRSLAVGEYVDIPADIPINTQGEN